MCGGPAQTGHHWGRRGAQKAADEVVHSFTLVFCDVRVHSNFHVMIQYHMHTKKSEEVGKKYISSELHFDVIAYV